MRHTPRGALALTAALLSIVAFSASAYAQSSPDTYVFKGEESFGSGSCSGEIVNFTGSYHEVIHSQFDDRGNLVRLNIMTGESNHGVGIGEDSGDRYVRVYRQNSVASFEYDPYTESAHGTYLSRVLHVGKDDALLADMWIRSFVSYRWTPEGFVRYTERYSTECM